jgi:glycosyltransferase involved in cell wall biosynthesis
MKILMLGTDLETHGGISAVVRTWKAHGLFERWPVEYIATHRDRSKLAKLGIAFAAFFRFAFLLLRNRGAIVHVHGASRASFWRKAPFMALAHLFRAPVVYHLHGGGFRRFYLRGCGALGRRVVRHFLDRAAAIVVVSERWERWIREVSANENVVCIANPVRFDAEASPQRGGSMVAFCGRVEAGKGVFELLEAVASLVPTLPEVRLEVAGDGDLAGLERRASELGIRAHVHLHGWIDDAKRDALLARARAFALPSHAEGLPVALLEAMSAGCAVVATGVGGIPDVVTDSVDGLLVPARDVESLARALRRVLCDDELAARLGANARATVAARFSPAHALAALETLYAELGAGRASTCTAPRTRRLQEIS